MDIENRIFTFSDLFKLYDENEPIPIEKYLVEQFGELYNEESNLDELFQRLNQKYGNKTFRIVPNNESIQWRGKLNSDWKVMIEE